MNTLIALCAILGGALAAPSGVNYGGYYVQNPVQPLYVQQVQTPEAIDAAKGPIITGTLHHSQDTYGQYKYGYSSSDGQAKEESRTAEGVVDGQFSYTSPEGYYILLSYQADQDGFRPAGTHLPQAPELPAELAAAYKEANDRLAAAYEEARLRKPLEGEKEEGGGEGGEGKGEGEGQGQEEEKGPEGTRAHQSPPTPVYPHVHQAPVYPQTPIYQVAVAPGYHAHQAPPSVYHVQQPVYQYVKPAVQVAYPTSNYYPAAPAPAAKEEKKEEEKQQEKEGGEGEEGGEGGQEEEKSNEPVPYLQSSYSTEIGGVSSSVKASAPAAPSPSYAHQPGHY